MKNHAVYIEQEEDGVLGSSSSVFGRHTVKAVLFDELISNLKEVIALCVRNIDQKNKVIFNFY